MSHLTKLKISQETGVRMEAHYLSPENQNEFIDACGKLVQQKIIAEVLSAKYYSIIVDATPDSAHIEQTTFCFGLLKMWMVFGKFKNGFCFLLTAIKKRGLISQISYLRSLLIITCQFLIVVAKVMIMEATCQVVIMAANLIF